MSRSTLKFLLNLLALLCAQSVGASTFVPISVPDGYDLSPINVDAKGNIAFAELRFLGEDDVGDLFEGTLYLNGSQFLRFGPDETYLRLDQYAAAGPGAVFIAQLARVTSPQNCGGGYKIFDGPNADPCVDNPPTLVPFAQEGQLIRANSKGEFLTKTPGNYRVYAPDQGYYLNGNTWFIPSWGMAAPSDVRIEALLEDGRVALVTNDCLQIYQRGPLSDPGNGAMFGGLQLSAESCVDSSISGGDSIAQHINLQTGNLSFCARPDSLGNRPALYLLAPGGSPQLVYDQITFGCEVYGSDSSGNVAFGTGSQVFWSDEPTVVTLSSGHMFNGKRLSAVRPIAVLNDRRIVATAQLLDPAQLKGGAEGLPPGFGLFFSDGDTDFPPAPPANVVVWNTNLDGGFFDSENWDPETVPTSDQVAVFAPDAPVSVTFGAQTATTERLFVERGPVVFNGGGYQLSNGSGANPSLMVRSGAPGDAAVLWLEGGHQLQTTGAMLDQGLSPAGQFNGVIVEDDLGIANPQSRWDNVGRLVVDASLLISWSGGVVSDSLRVASTPGSVGSVTLGPSPQSAQECPDIGIADFGSVSIGYAGIGTMTAGQNCLVEAAGDRIIGELAGSTGEVEFENSSWIRFFNPGPATDLTVGGAGDGTLRLLDAAVDADEIVVGQNAGSTGSIVVENSPSERSILDAESSLVVGAAGTGLVRTTGSSQVVAADVIIADALGSLGRVFLTGPSTQTNLAAQGALTVGKRGEGELEILDGAIVTSQTGAVGAGPQSRGLARTGQGGAWDLSGNLTVGLSSAGADPQVCDGTETSLGVGELQILGDGQIADVTGQVLIIDGPDSRLTGTGLAVFQNTLVINCAAIAPGTSPGTLTIDGNLELRGGVIEVELSGLGDGQYDVLNVSGDVGLAGGVVKFIFDGFLPQQGDEITFLNAGGALSIDDDMRYEYEGAVPGFELDVSSNGSGGLTFRANNNATSDSMFIDGFESP